MNKTQEIYRRGDRVKAHRCIEKVRQWQEGTVLRDQLQGTYVVYVQFDNYPRRNCVAVSRLIRISQEGKEGNP